jgi:hypothetical protein
MALPASGVPVKVLRAAALRRVEETNLRQAAAEIGLSWSGLRTFLRGTDPYSPTVQKLRVWFETTGQGTIPEIEQVREIIDSLSAYLPADGRPPAEHELAVAILGWCELWCERGRVPVPAWAVALRVRIRGGENDTGNGNQRKPGWLTSC